VSDLKVVALELLLDENDETTAEVHEALKTMSKDIVAAVERRTKVIVEGANVVTDFGDGPVLEQVR